MRKYSYAELIAWQRAMDLAAHIYEASRTLPSSERFGLTAQIRRTATSIPANIAEGQGRSTPGEFRNHLSIAYGSLCELETHVILARRLEMIDDETAKGILDRTAEVGRLINGLTKSLNN